MVRVVTVSVAVVDDMVVAVMSVAVDVVGTVLVMVAVDVVVQTHQDPATVRPLVLLLRAARSPPCSAAWRPGGNDARQRGAACCVPEGWQ